MPTKRTTNKLSQLYKTIDQKELSADAKKALADLRLATGNFRKKEGKEADAFMLFYNRLVNKKPTAVKTTKEYKAMLTERRRENGRKAMEARKAKEESRKGQGSERDAARPAKPFGWRLKGKHNYRKPTRADISSGRAYYEARVDRADSKRTKFPMLERGGKIFEKLEEGVYKVGKPIKVEPNLYEQKIVEIFANGDISTASDYGRKLSDFSGLNYPMISKEQLDAQYNMEHGGFMAKGGLIAYADGDYDNGVGVFTSMLDAKKFAKANKWRYETITFEDERGDDIVVSKDDTFKDIDFLFSNDFANGGYMAKGGEIPVINISDDDKLNYFIKKQNRKSGDSSFIDEMLTLDYKGKTYYSLGYDTPSKGQVFSLEEAQDNAKLVLKIFRGEYDVLVKEVGGNFTDEDFMKKTYVVMTSPLFPNYMLREMKYTLKYADGGYMEHGGEIQSLESKLKNIDNEIYIDGNNLKIQEKVNPTNFLTIRQVGKDLYNVDITSGSIQEPSKRRNSTWYNFGDKYHNYNELLGILKSYGIKKMADGGYMEHGGDVDKGGMIYALREFVSSGEIANKTDVLNYDDIAKIRRIAIQYYMDNGDVPYSYGELAKVLSYANDKFKSGMMAKGGVFYTDSHKQGH
jgi:hypothetical protein